MDKQDILTCLDPPYEALSSPCRDCISCFLGVPFELTIDDLDCSGGIVALVCPLQLWGLKQRKTMGFFLLGGDRKPL